MSHRFPQLTGFNWDGENRLKKEEKSGVSVGECEQVFFNEPLVMLDDQARSGSEPRYAAFGQTDENRRLTVIFTTCGPLLRVISARAMSRKKKEESAMSTPKNHLPKFKNEDQERAYWTTHSPLDHFDPSSAKRASFPNLKPSMKSISIRLPESMLESLKRLANKQDVPYQSLAKIYLAREIKRAQ